MAKVKPTGFTQPGQPQGQTPGWVQDPGGNWHPVVAQPRQKANPWAAVGWIVLVLLMVPCVVGGMIVGITALGASQSTTTTTKRPAVTTSVAPTTVSTEPTTTVLPPP